jgi:hypothetical protein
VAEVQECKEFRRTHTLSWMIVYQAAGWTLPNFLLNDLTSRGDEWLVMSHR